MLNLKHEKQSGIYYGYPKCCINFYLKHCGVSYWYNKFLDKYPKANRLLDGKGFIPCEKHLKEIEKGKILPKDLIKNRKAKNKYPIGDYRNPYVI